MVVDEVLVDDVVDDVLVEDVVGDVVDDVVVDELPMLAVGVVAVDGVVTIGSRLTVEVGELAPHAAASSARPVASNSILRVISILQE